MSASVTPSDLWILLLFSVRYAMGRRSAAPSDVAECVRAYATHLEPEHVAQIANEIRVELARARERGHSLGDECDHRMWEELARRLGGKGVVPHEEPAVRKDGAPAGEGLAGAIARLEWAAKRAPESSVTPDVRLVLAELARLREALAVCGRAGCPTAAEAVKP